MSPFPFNYQGLKLKFGCDITPYLTKTLTYPIEDLWGRPSKNIRGKLVAAGAAQTDVGPTSENLVLIAAQILESLHAGSLIVDDIQDDSLVRRGKTAIHRAYGLPVALNAGNSLYFWPLFALSDHNLPPLIELQVYRACHKALLYAHFGQALDVGIAVDDLPKMSLKAVCLASMELKSGALASLAISLGSILSGASEPRIVALAEYGAAFGVALQMFDDLGNLLGVKDPEKRWEDLKLRRPTWIWACAAEYFSDREFLDFVSAVRRLPAEGPLESWLTGQPSFLSYCREQAYAFLTQANDQLRLQVGPSADKLSSLENELRGAYGS